MRREKKRKKEKKGVGGEAVNTKDSVSEGEMVRQTDRLRERQAATRP